MEQRRSYCPSCGSETAGIYCPRCGEKVRIDKEELSLAFFLKDAFEEISSVDSKFLRTLRLLLTKPGFLTNEAIAGRKTLYIKPFRLYAIMVVTHFLIFSFSGSGDIFTIERFPVFQLIPGLYQAVQHYEVKSGLTHEVFTTNLNQKIKDNLNIIFYFIVFLLAFFFKLLYFNSGKYYVEHLYYLLYLLSFGLIRNIILIPLLIADLLPIAFVIVVATQLIYTFVSLKNVYHENSILTGLKVILGLAGFILVMVPALLLSVAIGIIQIT